MKYYYTYKITCTEGSFKGKFYFGQHSTNNLDDGYKGSGTLLKKYYKKYSNGYIKEILAFYDNQEDLNKAERDLIRPYIDDENCLNISIGGTGGDTYTYQTEERKQEIFNKKSASLKGKNKGKSRSEKQKQYLSEINTGRKLNLSDEERQKRSERMMGENNPMYGKATYGFKDHNHTDETKQLLSEISKQYYIDHPEAIEKCKEGGRKGKDKKHTKEWNSKISESLKKYHKNKCLNILH